MQGCSICRGCSSITRAPPKALGAYPNLQGDGTKIAPLHHHASHDASWILGLYLAFTVIDWKATVVPRQARLVLLLSAFHGALAKWTKDFAADRNTHDARFYRMMNEVPTLLMIGIVILVIVRPFEQALQTCSA